MRLTSEQIETISKEIRDIDVAYVVECREFEHSEFCVELRTTYNNIVKHITPDGEVKHGN